MDLLSLLEAFCPLNNHEEQLKTRFMAFVKSTPHCFKREHLAGHVTGSAWLLNPAKTHVLLTHHKKLDKWIQLGGHADGNPHILETCLREAQEESGILSITPLSPQILGIDIHLIPARKDEPEHFHYDVNFPFVANTDKFIVSEESNNLAWVKIEDILTGNYENSLKRLAQHWQILSQKTLPS
ncbi:NUDIX hydrolase [bacterium]|nr:NUDIX hydrolase [bacterium]